MRHEKEMKKSRSSVIVKKSQIFFVHATFNKVHIVDIFVAYVSHEITALRKFFIEPTNNKVYSSLKSHNFSVYDTQCVALELFFPL